MENVDTVIDDYGNDSALSLTSTAMNFLKETAKWAKFLSILGFIGLGFMVLAALFLMTMGTNLSQVTGGGMLVSSSFIGLFYIVIVLLYFFPLMYLYKFSNTVTDAILNKDKQRLEESLGFLKSHYKFIGIFAIVMIALYVLMFLFGIVAGVTSAAM
jgi:uncharacterized membrane protein